MAPKTLYIVQAFSIGNRGVLVPTQPIHCKSSEEAIRRATGMKESRAGIVAYTTTGDAETGDYDERPTVLSRSGACL